MIPSTTSPIINENFESNGDHGVRLQLLKAMETGAVLNTLFVATRHCKPGFAHIGMRRFAHVKDVCFSALS
jgi:hypothetical protein